MNGTARGRRRGRGVRHVELILFVPSGLPSDLLNVMTWFVFLVQDWS